MLFSQIIFSKIFVNNYCYGYSSTLGSGKPVRIMGGVGVDVVCVRCADSGVLSSTEFLVRFRVGVAQTAAKALLGLSDGASTKQGSEAFFTGGQGVGGNRVMSSDEHSLQGAPTCSRSPEVLWVDIFCNGQLCENVLAYTDMSSGVVLWPAQGPNGLIEEPAVCTPSTDILERLGLVHGKNSITARHRKLGDEASFFLWLYSTSDRLVIMDIDGTITRSDVRGYIESVYLGMYTYVHEGVVPLLHAMTDSLSCNVVYVTSRPLAHQRETRLLLGNVRENSLKLPDGPLFMSRESTGRAAFRELVTRTTMELKIGLLSSIKQIFVDALGASDRGDVPLSAAALGGSLVLAARGVTNELLTRDCSSHHHQQLQPYPFVWGIGNKPADCEAYRSVGVPNARILLIDVQSNIRVWSLHALMGLEQESSKDYERDETTTKCGVDTVLGQTSHNFDHNRNGVNIECRTGTVFRGYRDPRLLQYVLQR